MTFILINLLSICTATVASTIPYSHPGYQNNNFAVQSDIHSYNTRQDLLIDSSNTKLAENTIKTQDPIIGIQLTKLQRIANPLPLFKNPLRNKFLPNTTLMSPPTSTLLYLKLLFFFNLCSLLPLPRTLILLYRWVPKLSYNFMLITFT